MAGTLKVDSINADSNLTLKIANTAVAFIDSNGLRPSSGNVSLDATGTSKFYLPSANTVAIQTAGVTAVTVDSSQNVTLAGTLTTTGITNSGVATGARFNPTGSSATGTGMYLPAADSLGFSANGTNAVYIDSSQRIGIGTSSPEANAKMTVYGGGIGISTNSTQVAPTGYDLKIRSNTSLLGIHTDNSSGVPTIEFGNGASGYCTIKGTAAVAMTFQTNSTERFRITGNGGLSQNGDWGTNASTALRNNSAAANKFWQSGPDSNNAYIVYNQAGNGVYVTDGGTSWAGLSDERLKDIIEPIENGLTKVASLRAVIGKFKTDAEGTRRSFLIAQDVQVVLPEAISIQNEETGTLGLSYTDVIPLLVASIKELKALNDTQAATIAALTARMVAVESK